MVESRRFVSNVIISIILKKGWFSYVRVSLKQDEYHICMAQLSLYYNPFKRNSKYPFQCHLISKGRIS